MPKGQAVNAVTWYDSWSSNSKYLMGSSCKKMSEKNHFNDLVTNKSYYIVFSYRKKYSSLLRELQKVVLYVESLRINRFLRDSSWNSLCHGRNMTVRKNGKSKNALRNNLLHKDDCEKMYQRHSKPVLDTNKISHSKKCTTGNVENKSACRDADILKHMIVTFFRETKEIPLSNHEVIDIKHKLRTVEVSDSNSITDVERCVKAEPELCKIVEQNDCRDADSDTQLLDVLITKNRQFSTTTQIFHVYNVQGKSHPKIVSGIPWNHLNEERLRLVTFAQYPHTAQKSAILLANGGFAYCGAGKDSDDTVICYFCCSLKRGWLASDDIQETHRQLSPDCCMVTGEPCNNIPMTVPVNGNTLFIQFYNSNNVNGNTLQNAEYKRNNDLECDGSESNTTAENRNNLATPAPQVSRNVTSAHLSEFANGANQTDVRPGASSTSMNHEATRPSTANNQPLNTGASSSTVSSNNSTLNSTSTLALPNRTPATPAQEASINNISSTAAASSRPATAAVSGTPATAAVSSRPATAAVSSTPATAATAAVSSRPATAVQTPASDRQNVTEPSVTPPSHVNQSTQNSSSAVSTALPNQSGNQSQGNSSSSATGNSQNTGQGNSRGPTYGELGIITERPKRFEYAVTSTRFTSFEHWPRDHPLKKEDLAAAGFYYAGYGDCARCFYCGGGLRNWEDDDNVWVEHARWFPKCAFMRQTIGQQFVDTVQDLNKSCEKITYQMVTDKMGSTAASFQLDTRNVPLKRDPAVLTVMEMGYSEADVIEAANYVKENCTVLSSDKIFEKLEKDGKSRVNDGALAASSFKNSNQTSNPPKDERIMNKLKEENGQLRQQTVCKICMDKEVAVVFLPCGHFVSCTDCAAAMKDCPVCRKQVRGIVRAFMG